MAEVAEAYVSLIPSAKGFKRGIERQIGGDVERAGRDAGRKSGKAFGGAFSGSAKSLIAGAGIGLGVAEAFSFLKDSVGEASDLNETVSKSRVIFGQGSAAIEQWAKVANKSVGLSDQAALDAAASFGDMFSQIGLGGPDAASMSKSVVQLAADLGSFNNLGTDDVLERIAGGFRGEYDALQKVIPNISAARVETEALRLSNKKSTKELTAAEKAQATLAIIQKDGARATGDFARTSDGLANSQKILGSQVDDLQAKIGKGLLPVTTDVVNAVSDFVEGMEDGTGAGGEFADLLGDIKDIGEGVYDVFSAIPPDVLKVGAALGIGAVAVGKLNSAIAASRLTAFVTDLGKAETRAARTSRALQGLGAVGRNVAGAGGMLLLAHSTQQTNKELGVLEATAGGALSGAALGAFAGPVGAAVGGAIGGIGAGLFTMAKQDKAARKSAEISIGSWKEYGQTLEGVEVATTNATRAMVRQRLEESGLLTATRQLGLSDRQAVNAVMGVSNARRILSQRLRENHGLTSQQEDALIAETGAIEKSRLATLRNNVAIAGTEKELRDAKAALAAFSPADVDIRTQQAKDRVTDLRKQLEILAGIRPTVTVNVSTNVLDPSGLLGNTNPRGPRIRGSRALGGPVSSGRTYLVGERGPELFTASQNGRILNHNDLNTGASGPRTVLLQVGERQFTAYMSEVADSRVDLARADDGMTDRAFG